MPGAAHTLTTALAALAGTCTFPYLNITEVSIAGAEMISACDVA